MAEVKIAADSGGGSVGLVGPASTTSNAAVQLKLPVADGSANQFLQTDGSGNLGWAAGGKIVAVTQTVKSDTDSSSTAQGAYSGALISHSHAAASSSNKLLIIANVNLSVNSTAATYATLHIGGSPSAFRGDASSNRNRVSGSARSGNSGGLESFTIVYLHSSPSTSSTAYDIRGSHANDATQTFYINRTSSDTDANYEGRCASSIIIVEVGA
tara:strand:- start:430 stop:1068 length:639 start_codon:yes stop_codon:yes gene_type:complete